jgi:hypothetical protein
VIEFDRDLIAPLTAAAEPLGELTIVHRDVLRVDFTELAAGQPIRLVGNLPYNISSPILFHAGTCRGDPRHALHAAEGSGRPHGRWPWQQGVWPPQRDAAGLLPGDLAVRGAAGRSGRCRRSIRPWCGWCRATGHDQHQRSQAFAEVVKAAFGQRRRPCAMP